MTNYPFLSKVAIFSSAFLGTISGSSIANTVTTGSLTIPAMKKVGYPPHFSGAVEATASAAVGETIAMNIGMYDLS